MHFTHLHIACCHTCGHVPLNDRDRATCPACGRVDPLVKRGKITIVNGGPPRPDLIERALWPFDPRHPSATERVKRTCVLCDQPLENFEDAEPLEDTLTNARAWAHRRECTSSPITTP